MYLPKTSGDGKENTVPLLKIIIVTILAVSFWRGLWWLFDKYFFPGNIVLSHVLCLVLPIIIVVGWIMLSGMGFSLDLKFPSEHHIF